MNRFSVADQRHTVEIVLEHVAFEMERELGDILGASREQMLTWARYAAAWLARRHTPATQAQIGLVLGNREQGTVSHEIRRACALREIDSDFRWLTDHLDSLLVEA